MIFDSREFCENQEDFIELSEDYDKAVQQGLRHFAPPPDIDTPFIDKLITSLQTQAGELERRWKEHRSKYFEVCAYIVIKLFYDRTR